jgi:hypothetical protein
MYLGVFGGVNSMTPLQGQETVDAAKGQAQTNNRTAKPLLSLKDGNAKCSGRIRIIDKDQQAVRAAEHNSALTISGGT